MIAMQHLGIELPPEPLPRVTVSYLGDAAKSVALKLVETLRGENIGTLLTLGDRSLKAQLKAANRAEADFAIILGQDEVEAGQVTVRNMNDSEQVKVDLEKLVAWLNDRLKGLTD